MKTYREDIITMALLYRKEYIGTDIISYESIQEYEKIVNDNLEDTDYQFRPYAMFSSCKIYSILQDENKNSYAVITSNENLMEASRLLDYIPLELAIAATKDNAFSAIGLIREKGKVKSLIKTNHNYP